jgi:hypothetical protein
VKSLRKKDSKLKRTLGIPEGQIGTASITPSYRGYTNAGNVKELRRLTHKLRLDELMNQ